MSEKFEQKKTTITEEALEKRVSKNQPFEHKKSVIDSSQKEFKKTSDEYELIEGSPYIDKKEYQQDLTEETLHMAKDIIGKLAHKKEMSELTLIKYQDLNTELQNAAEKEYELEENLKKILSEYGEDTKEYLIAKKEYEEQKMHTMAIEEKMNVPEGNLFEIYFNQNKIDHKIKERETAIDENNAHLN